MTSPDDDDLKAFPGKLFRGGKPLDLGPSSRVEDVVRVLGEVHAPLPACSPVR